MKTQATSKQANQCFEVEQFQLLEFLRLAKPGIDRILTGVVLGSRNGRLYANVTTRLASVTKNFGPWGYDEQAPIFVPFKELWTLVKGSDSQLLKLHWDSERLYVDSDNTRQTAYASLDCKVPMIPDIETIGFPSMAIADAMPAILKMIEPDAIRNYGSIALLYAKTYKMGFVGTDGFRLAISEYRLGNTDYTRFDGLCIPALACEQLLLAAKSGQELRLGITEDRTTLALQVGSDTFAFFCTSAVKYPNYSGVIPKASIGQNFVVKELLATVKQALRTTDKSRMIKITSENGQMLIQSRQELDHGPWSDYRVAFPGQFDMGPEPYYLNGKFLADCLEATKEKIGKLCIASDREQPITITLGAVDTVLVPIVYNPEVKK